MIFERRSGMKFIKNAAVALAKLYVLCAIANNVSYLNYKVKELEAEINKLKNSGE